MDEGLADCDIVMMLRIQNERMSGNLFPSVREYFRFFGLTRERLANAREDALVMHPGPMNRGVEIDSEVADDISRSLIQEQVMGSPSMACLERFAPLKRKRRRASSHHQARPSPGPQGLCQRAADRSGERLDVCGGG